MPLNGPKYLLTFTGIRAIIVPRLFRICCYSRQFAFWRERGPGNVAGPRGTVRLCHSNAEELREKCLWIDCSTKDGLWRRTLARFLIKSNIIYAASRLPARGCHPFHSTIQC